MKKRYTLLLLTILLNISSCTTILDKTTSEPIVSDPGKRTLGTYLDDQRLEVIVSVNLNKADPQLKLSHVDVTSFNNIILLTGQVPTQELKLLASSTAKAVNMVEKVYNELQIKGNTALLVRSNDVWLNTKIKAAYLTDNIINSSKVKVVVEDGVAYLMGIATRAEADYIADVTSRISGIQEVVKVFEYIN